LYHLATAQTLKGKRVTGLMPGTAVRNNIYKRGGPVTLQFLIGRNSGVFKGVHNAI